MSEIIVVCELCFREIFHFKGNRKQLVPFSVASTIYHIQRALPMLRGFTKHLCFCVDIRSVLIPIITPTTLNSFPAVLTLFLLGKKSAFYYVFACFAVCINCSALHVIKAGVWQSYHWPTAVITMGLHSCVWLTHLGNVITKVSLTGGTEGASCEACVFAQAIPVTLSSYPNSIPGHETRCTVQYERSWGSEKW